MTGEGNEETIDELDSIDNFRQWQAKLKSVMAEQAKDVEVSYIDKLKQRAAISYDLEHALKKISQ